MELQNCVPLRSWELSSGAMSILDALRSWGFHLGSAMGRKTNGPLSGIRYPLVLITAFSRGPDQSHVCLTFMKFLFL